MSNNLTTPILVTGATGFIGSNLVVADAGEIPFQDGSFDFV
jgi:hypothetical protein